MTPSWAAAVDAFGLCLRARSSSPHTLEAYLRDVGALAEFISTSRGREPEPVAVMADDIRAYLASIGGRSPATRNRALAAFRSFFGELVRRELVPTNVAREVYSAKQQRRLPEILTVDDVEKLVTSPDQSLLGRRNRALLEVLYSSGLRVSELVGLNLGDIRGHLVRVLGKGRKERVVPIGRIARNAVARWLTARSVLKPKPSERALFLSNELTRLTTRGVEQMTARIGREVLGRAVTPHLLRHAFGTHLLAAGASLRDVQELLGHESIRTTQLYTHVTFEWLQKVHARAHPRLLARRPAPPQEG